jgi:superoxide dismutase, Fe-Mn family
MPHTLPALPYACDALEPHIDAKTMHIHHGKHHQTYIDNLNAAVLGTQYAEIQAERLIVHIDALPEALRVPIRNNGGGHVNHSLFWSVMAPVDQGGGGAPDGALAKAISADLGSGWAWLVVGNDGKLSVEHSGNQDNPLMQGIGSGGTPILGLDVWEHAYYLQYQNRRPEYIAAFYNVIHWPEVARRYAQAHR